MTSDNVFRDVTDPRPGYFSATASAGLVAVAGEIRETIRAPSSLASRPPLHTSGGSARDRPAGDDPCRRWPWP
ncbi:hypothetical protein FRAHR75_600034 [Frankia sp. Hr75.2]|nr:hypothetical protein FRAHR75_600034 [Frankia sp. Hr75.2]